MDINPTTLILGAGGITAILATGVTRIQDYFARLLGHIICMNTLNICDAFTVIGYLNKHYKRSKIGHRYFVIRTRYLKNKSLPVQVITESLGVHNQLFWKGLAPIWVKPVKKDCEATFYYFRWTFSWEKLLMAAVEWKDNLLTSKERSRFSIVRRSCSRISGTQNRIEATTSNGKGDTNFGILSLEPAEALNHNEDDIATCVRSQHIQDISLTETLQEIIDETKFWLQNQAWYEHRSIPWRRGYVFCGQPGSGKTTFAKYLAQTLGLPINIFDLSNMDNDMFAKQWQDMGPNLPAIVVFEDFDNIFKGRTNLMATQIDRGLTFDCLINHLDGINSLDGVITIITTNNIDHLDPALGGNSGDSVRPGRIDRVIQIEGTSYPGRLKIANRILEDQEIAEKMAAEYTEDTPAKFQERCIQVALKQKWVHPKTKETSIKISYTTSDPDSDPLEQRRAMLKKALEVDRMGER